MYKTFRVFSKMGVSRIMIAVKKTWIIELWYNSHTIIS
jgi:hypothetical protein